MINKTTCNFLLFALAWIAVAMGQDATPVPINAEGRITYITINQVYSNLGTNAGSEMGDTLTVYRRNEEIGLLVITNLARNSSVCKPLIPTTEFQLGDRVLLEKTLVSPTLPESISEIAAEDTSGFVLEKSVQERRVRFKQNGTLSLRYSQSHYSKSANYTTGINSLQYTMGVSYPVQTQLWIYGRSDLIRRTWNLYQIRASIGESKGRLYTQIGRVFSPELAGIGATDGLLITARISSKYSLGLLGGVQPDPSTFSFDPSVKKAGIYGYLKTAIGNTGLKGSVAVVGQYSNTIIDREFIYGSLYGRRGSKLNFSFNQTIDIHRAKQNVERDKIELTSNQGSLRIRALEWLTFTTRYSSRKQILYKASGISVPDSLFDNALRSGWYNSVQIENGLLGSLQGGFNLRTQSGKDKRSTLVFISYQSNPIRGLTTVVINSNYIKNLVIRGMKNSIGLMARHNNTSFYGEYEYYNYGFGNKILDYSQNTFSGSMHWRILSKMNGSLSLDYTIDKNIAILYVFAGVVYRF